MSTARDSETIAVQIDRDLKAEAEAILAEIGISPEYAIELYYKLIVRVNGLPREMYEPNEETQESLRNIEEGKDLSVYRSYADFLKEMEEGDE